jgi:hypothetical protein
MATDIINGLSPNELSKEITRLMEDDQRALPHNPKVFAAIAKRQGFDVLPDVGSVEELNEAIKAGYTELNRGVSATKGVPSLFYARELTKGAMYPGTLSALGNGMYFAAPSSPGQNLPGFPLVSVAALKYTKGGGEAAGFLIRAALKKEAKIADCDDLKQDLRENRNRAKRAGITDVGAFAAALGFDAFFADRMYTDTDERVYVVLNRGMLLVQKQGIFI